MVTTATVGREREERRVALVGLGDEDVPAALVRARSRTTARSPPIANDGSSPQCCSATVSIDVVEVLPAVPVTAASRRPAVSAASACARCTTGRPRSRAAASSGLLSRIADDTTTVAGAAGRWAASCPTATSAPSARSASTVRESFASEPDTAAPLASRIRAMPLIPAPPMPIRCTRSASPLRAHTAAGPLVPPAAALRGRRLDGPSTDQSRTMRASRSSASACPDGARRRRPSRQPPRVA